MDEQGKSTLDAAEVEAGGSQEPPATLPTRKVNIRRDGSGLPGSLIAIGDLLLKINHDHTVDVPLHITDDDLRERPSFQIDPPPAPLEIPQPDKP